MSDKGNLKVLKGEFGGGGDPYVEANFLDAIAKLSKIDGGAIKAFAIVVVSGKDSVSSTYDEGQRFHALIGGLSSLADRMHKECA